MDSARIPLLVLAAAAAAAGCRTGDDLEDPFAGMYDRAVEEPGNPVASAEAGDPGGAAPEQSSPRDARFTFGAWGFDGRLEGDAADAPSDHGMDASAIPGFSFEARFHKRAETPGSWTTAGFLLEHFRSAEEKSVAGGKARTEGSLTGAWVFLGIAGEPQRDARNAVQDFYHRLDFMIGLRRGSVMAEVPDGSGGKDRGSGTWGELAFGLRGELAPCRRVFLFARGDVGSEGNLRSLFEDEETGGDSAVGSLSVQFLGGIRVRPVDHVSLLFGWRYLRLDGKEFVDEGTGDVRTARASWSGPWAGLEVDF